MVCANAIINAELVGAPTHGLSRLKMYCDRINKKVINPQPKLKIKKGDEVIVVTGKDKGKKGTVLEVFPLESRVKVQGVNLVKRHRRPTQTSPGGIDSVEASMHISNVAHVDPDSGKATRVGYRLEEGNKVRVAKASGKVIS